MGLRIAGLRIAGLLDTVYGEQNCWQRSFGAIQTSICLGYEICIIFWILMSGLNISSHLCLYMLKPLPRITRYHSFCQEYRYCRCWISRTHQLPLHNNASEHDVESNEHGTMVPRNRLLHFWILFLYSLPLFFFLKKKKKKRFLYVYISFFFSLSIFMGVLYFCFCPLWGCACRSTFLTLSTWWRTRGHLESSTFSPWPEVQGFRTLKCQNMLHW